ncbi:DUF5304 domain-containing protein [Streptomyces sp. JB150]|uniref:DUF5304 domain-containing protein n=1 Tax=Streptomyces sp. JB150 TaxID=2714844 RepID=UPI0014073967|nr:DUF5304 domain-containing protein [Streptomyces sp. JB150]QIJ62898.1 DUF5304 domain-containing protein [Streptomyces sp. JB150]
MSEERPSHDAARDQAPDDQRSPGDPDAWATACAEDLEAEKARRRDRRTPPPGSAAEELRKFVDTALDKLAGLQSPLLGAVGGPAAQQVVQQVVEQAKAAVEPVIERNPDVFDHLAAAGQELLAAYRSAVQAQERRWTGGTADVPRTPGSEGTGKPDGTDGTEGPSDHRRDPGEDSGPGQRIDLD